MLSVQQLLDKLNISTKSKNRIDDVVSLPLAASYQVCHQSTSGSLQIAELLPWAGFLRPNYPPLAMPRKQGVCPPLPFSSQCIIASNPDRILLRIGVSLL